MVTLYQGDCREVLRTLPGGSAHCCVTSPPYFGLRDYGVGGQIGLEPSPQQYVDEMVAVFREVRRVLWDDGTLWLNLGDSYAGGGGGNYTKGSRNNSGQNVTNVRNRGDWLETAGVKAKDLIGIPWRVAFALQADGWYLRQDIIWHKPNPMPESVRDRCTKAHEYIFLLSKSPRYYFDADAIKEAATSRPAGNKTHTHTDAYDAGSEGERHRKKAGLVACAAVPYGKRNRRSVWTVPPKPYRAAHFATYPPELIRPCVLAGCPRDGVVLDPFAGAGTTMLVAAEEGRRSLGIELNPAYCELIEDRIGRDRVVRVPPSSAPTPTDPQSFAAAPAAVVVLGESDVAGRMAAAGAARAAADDAAGVAAE